jgi:acyl-CoA synthetase (AMP-forming)/AMP-acid ligase II
VIYPKEKLIYELFEEQVARTPNSMAVVYEGRSFTYSELNTRSNQLARYLRDRRIGPDRLVGIWCRAQCGNCSGRAGGAQSWRGIMYPSIQVIRPSGSRTYWATPARA